MNKLKVSSKRVRPLLGTFVEISIFSAGNFDNILTLAYDEAQKLENIFNLKNPKSEINNITKTMSPQLKEVLLVAEKIFIHSEGAFCPYRNDLNSTATTNSANSQEYDLNGIAKGFIVDQMVEKIMQQDPSLSGVVNAGGDLRFFNRIEKNVHLRLGSMTKPIFRELQLTKNALASSSPSLSQYDAKSSTIYSKNLRQGLDSNPTVSVIADTCMIADALTKVGLMANSNIAQNCCLLYNAQMMIFNAKGELTEVFGRYETE